LKSLILSVPVVFSLSVGAVAAEKVLAKVNGKAITEKDLAQMINSLPPNYQTLKNNPQFRKQLLQNLVKEELLYQEAIKEGIDKDPQVQKEIELMKRRILVQALVRKHIKLSPVSVSDSEAKAFYEKNKATFKDANGKTISYNVIKPFIVKSLQQQKEKQEFSRALNNYVNSIERKSKVEILTK
jgi:peptidyl-prolyl cis-trans isomerase C